MPTEEQCAEIERVVSGYEADYGAQTADAMHDLFYMTEDDSFYPADELIYVAACQEGRVRPEHVKFFAPYGLSYWDGRVPENISYAVQDAIETQHLRLVGISDPHMHFDPRLIYSKPSLGMDFAVNVASKIRNAWLYVRGRLVLS